MVTIFYVYSFVKRVIYAECVLYPITTAFWVWVYTYTSLLIFVHVSFSLGVHSNVEIARPIISLNTFSLLVFITHFHFFCTFLDVLLGVFISAFSELEPPVFGLLGSVLWTVARKTASMHDHHLSKVVTICIITGDEIVMTWNEGCNVLKLGVGKARVYKFDPIHKNSVNTLFQKLK